MNNWERWILIILAVGAILFIVMYFPAKAETAHEGHDKLHSFYETLMRPDFPNSSCCNQRDCTQVQARYDQQGQYWEFLKGKRWVRVPQSKINQEDSPDEKAHACWLPSTTDTDAPIFCFVRPSPGI